VSSKSTFVVEKKEEGAVNNGNSWKKVNSTLFQNANAAKIAESAPYNLYFDTGSVAPIGMSLYRVRKDVTETLTETGPSGVKIASSIHRSLRNRQGLEKGKTCKEKSLTFQNDVIKIKFEMGVMTKISLLADNVDVDVDIKQEWGYYNSFQDSSAEQQRSGAYIFRPSSPTEELKKILVDPSKTKVFSDHIVTEIHTEFVVPWIKQITRITSGQPHVDIEYTIGPIPIDDGKGKEIVTRFITGIENNGIFHTDSNGREFISRKRSARQSFEYEEFEPIAGNYYPVNAAIFLEDAKLAMAVLPDRSQGGSSVSDGVLELMVQRRTIHDDGRGVGEAMNETDSGMTPYPPYGDASRQGKGVIITGAHRLLIGKGRIGASLARSQMDAMFSPLHVFAASAPSNLDISFHEGSWSAVKDNLPRNIQLITAKVLSLNESDVTILLRLGHAYGLGESDDLSVSVAIDLSKLFTGYVIKSFDEKTVTANQDRAEWNTRKMYWTNKLNQNRMMVPNSGENDSHFSIHIKPMEIKTLEVHAQAIP